VSHPKVEYLFLAKQTRIDDFKSTLTKKGEEGWEYAGLVPGTDELIFKRSTQPMGMSNLASWMTMHGMGSPGEVWAASLTAPPSRGGTSLPGGSSSQAGPSRGSNPTKAGGSQMALPANIDLQVGETIRYAMASDKPIQSLVSNDSKIVEVTLDPLDARRVVIRSLSSGVGKLVLTDSLGAKETYTVRVK